MIKKHTLAELQRDVQAGDIYRARWTPTTRETYHNAHPENFAEPDDASFPIKDASDVNDAWRLAGHADDPDAVRAKIKAIAQRLGLESGLPEAAKEETRAAEPDDDDEDEDDSDSEEDDEDDSQDEEDEEEDDEPPKKPIKTKAKKEQRSTPSPDVLYYAPITRFDKEKREVIGVATAEAKDAHGTVISYDGSKEAFAKWRGNIREMHDPKKAVGRALEITPDDKNRRIVVRATISKGAEDTWQKVIDGTLTGFSIGGKNGVWTERIIGGEKLPYLERYDQVELSLVDNPSCPGCDVKVVRANGMASEALASEDETDISRVPETDIERVGATISAATREGMHAVRDQLHGAHKQACENCGCDECQGHGKTLKLIDDNDGDMDGNELARPGAARAMIAEIVREQVADTLRTQISPVVARINALLAHDAGRSENPDFTRNFTALTERNDAFAAQLAAIQALVEKIAGQPVDGGPILHGGSGAPAEKRLSLQDNTHRNADDADVLRRAMELGFAPPSGQEAQILAASKFVRR